MTLAKEYSFTVYRKRICPPEVSGLAVVYANMRIDSRILPPRHSLEKPAFGGSLRNRVEGSILSAHARDLQRKRPRANHWSVCPGPL